ncbi:MAG: hypothetical protein ACOY3Y_21345 [Acidobacteriota bacterium]
MNWIMEKAKALLHRARVLFDWVWGEPGSEFSTWLIGVQRYGLYRSLSVERIVSIYQWAQKAKGVSPMGLPVWLALRNWWDDTFTTEEGYPDHNPPGWRGGHELSPNALARGVEDTITRWRRQCEVAQQYGFAPPLLPRTLGVVDPSTGHRSYRDWFDVPAGMRSITLREALEDPQFANLTLLAEVKKRLAA